MLASIRGMSRNGWWQLARWTGFGTLGCIALSVTYNMVAFWGHSEDAFRQGLISATVIPILLAGPLFFYLTLKLRELAIANHKLTVLATTDSLTSVLNRGAFAAKVDALLSAGGGERAPVTGAFLLIDADHFKSINDIHGHEHGDEALRLIAAAIRTSVRKNDLVGRLGGEEFGVFLPGATHANAMLVAERVRAQIEQTPFRPAGRSCRLSASIGGASFEEGMSFGDLFRVADERLYVAKHAGRNRVSLAHAPSPNRAMAASAALH